MKHVNQNPKLCIVCTSESPVDYTYEYLIFITDLKGGIRENGGEDEVVAFMIPSVRLNFECFILPAFCVVGSTLYIFEGYHDKRNINGKSVLTYQLSDETTNLKLERSMLNEAPPMNGHKVSPKATVTPDGKILVFSSVIRLYSPNKFDFELYEPEKKMWRKLPALPPLSDFHKGLYYFRIQSFTFMYKTVLFIRTDIGVFTLDLKLKKELIWKTSAFRGDECIPSYLRDFVVIGRDICVTPYCAYDIRVRGTHPRAPGIREDVFATLDYTFPDMSSFSHGYSDQSASVILLDHQVKRRQDFSVCFLDAAINDETKLPELMLQIYYCDLTKCRKELSTFRKKKVKESPIWWERKRETFLLPNTSKIRSFKIVAIANTSRRFNLCSFSPVGI